MGFNVVLGGYMSTKRVAESIDMDLWIPGIRSLIHLPNMATHGLTRDLWIPATVDAAVGLCTAILRIFRDEGCRKDL